MPRPSRTSARCSRGRSLRVETLEDRRVLSATLEMLTDVGATPQPDDSNPYQFVEAVGLTFFTTRSSLNGPTQTWVTDGTTNATRLLSEVLPGNLTVGGVVGNVAGKLYFSVTDPIPVRSSLWQWEGLGSEPTPLLSAAGDRINTSSPFTEVNGVWYFAGQSGSEGPELWRTDGTQAGTYLVREIRPGALGGLQPPSNAPQQTAIFNVGGTLMFIANDGTHGSELWTSDGTDAGTFMVQDIGFGSTSGVYGGQFTGRIATVVGDRLYFSATDDGFNSELWCSDGTSAGTQRVKEINPGAAGSTPQHLTNVGGVLYFAANDGVNGPELWKSDGTEAGTTLVKNIETSARSFGPFDLTEMNGLLYFASNDSFWRSDGTEAGTTVVQHNDPLPTPVRLPRPNGGLGQTNANVDHIVNLNGTLYFAAQHATGYSDVALWKYNGSGYATRVLSKTMAGPNGTATFETINFLAASGGKLYFAGDSQQHGNEPWVSDGTAAGTRLLKDVTGVSASSNVSGLINVNGTLHFVANTAPGAVPPRGLWSTNGSLAGTVNFAAAPGSTGGFSILGSVGGLTFFRSNGTAGSGNWELWRTDGTQAGTFQVKDIRPGAEPGLWSETISATVMNGHLYFTADDGVHGFELWRSDGTEAGTTLVADLRPGVGSGLPWALVATNVNGTLYFAANDGSNGPSLWKTDGTAAGTSLVRTFTGGNPTRLHNGNGTLYFAGRDYSDSWTLWKSDGTTAGTAMVRDVSLILPSQGVAQPFANVGDTLYFTMNDGVHGFELWKSDGTAAGTTLVKDINPAGSGLEVNTSAKFTVVGNTLYFFANDGVSGRELWKSDGSEAGTVLVKDIEPGPGPSEFGIYTMPANVSGVLYFSARTTASGIELWRSDGTEAGTFVVRDLNRTNGRDSSPTSLTNVNGLLYFLANDGVHGQELWVLRPEVVEPLAGDYNNDGRVDGADFLAWQRGFGSATTPAGSGADGDSDGTIGGGDLDVWKNHYGAASSDGITVAALAAPAITEVAEFAMDELDESSAAVSAIDAGAVSSRLAARDALFAAGDFSRLAQTESGSEAWGFNRLRGRVGLRAPRT